MTRGKIKLIIGPMFAGKTTTLLAEVERCIFAKKKCVIIKNRSDTRYDHLARVGDGATTIITHNGSEFARAPVILASKLRDCSDAISSYDVIAVMEINFFDDAPDIIDEWANAGKYVILDGLSGDFKRTPFGKLPEIIPLCDEFIQLKAVCAECGYDACFTARYANSEQIPSRTFASKKEEIVVGAGNLYLPLCRECYNNKKMKGEISV